MITHEKVRRMVEAIDGYAADGCYLASERQLLITLQRVAGEFMDEEDITPEVVKHYQRLFKLCDGR